MAFIRWPGVATATLQRGASSPRSRHGRRSCPYHRHHVLEHLSTPLDEQLVARPDTGAALFKKPKLLRILSENTVFNRCPRPSRLARPSEGRRSPPGHVAKDEMAVAMKFRWAEQTSD
jgi:hypothetical protein